MPGVNVFLNYRRDDTAGHAGRLFDRLNWRFPGRVFRDVSGIDYGADFVKEIEHKLASCQVLVVVIGKQWLTLQGEDGRRRLDDEQDYVRLEIATGLRAGTTIIPVLVGGARMPRAAELPDDLKPLATRNALEITEPDFDNDVGRLIGSIERLLGEGPRPPAPPPPPAWKKTALVAALCLVAVVASVAVAALLIFRASDPQPAATHLASGPDPAPSPSPKAAAAARTTPDRTPPPEPTPDNSADTFVPAGSWRVHREDTPWMYVVYRFKPGNRMSLHSRSEGVVEDYEGEWAYDKLNHVLTLWSPGKDGFARHSIRISRKEGDHYWVFHSTLGGAMMKPEP